MQIFCTLCTGVETGKTVRRWLISWSGVVVVLFVNLCFLSDGRFYTFIKGLFVFVVYLCSFIDIRAFKHRMLLLVHEISTYHRNLVSAI